MRLMAVGRRLFVRRPMRHADSSYADFFSHAYVLTPTMILLPML
jgi:hypothetical protein